MIGEGKLDLDLDGTDTNPFVMSLSINGSYLGVLTITGGEVGDRTGLLVGFMPSDTSEEVRYPPAFDAPPHEGAAFQVTMRTHQEPRP